MKRSEWLFVSGSTSVAESPKKEEEKEQERQRSAAEEADKIFALLTGGEIEFQQWYHMPDKKKPHDPLLRLQRTKVAMADPEAHALDRLIDVFLPAHDTTCRNPSC